MSSSTPRDYAKETRHRDKMLKQKQKYTSYDGKLDKFAYRFFGDKFDDKKAFLAEYQQVLKSAHIPVSSDLYIARTILYTLILFTSMLLTVGLISIVLLTQGIFSLVTDSSVANYVLTLGLPIFSSMVSAILFGFIYYKYPSYIASRRRSSIDSTLPSAVTFLYALNRGGMNISQALRILAENDNVYGEVSKEVGTVIQDMEYFSRDMLHALRRAGERSPSQKFSDLMDDMVSTMDSGASMPPFLEQKSEDLIVEAERDQKNFLETLELLGEVYVTAFVAGPLFMIIITVIMAMMGGAEPTQLDGIVYGLLPLMNMAYFFLINILSGTGGVEARTIEKKKSVHRKSDVDLEDYIESVNDERLDRVYKAKKKRERMALIRQPITELMRNPNLTMLFTGPIALIYLILVPILGLAEVSMGAFVEEPVIQTMAWLLVPILIVSLPLTIFFEISSRRERRMMNRFPDALKQLASANSVGMTLTESLETTAENTSGRLGEEFMLVKNDIKWNNDVNAALIKFSNRVRIPIVTRTIKLITEANESTGDIENVIAVAAKNVETQVRLKKERSDAMLMYTAVILISFAVYMFVIALLDIMFLSTIGDMGDMETGDAAGGGGGDGGAEFDLAGLPVERFRMVFYHSTIVQAFGSGMIAGYLKSNDVRSGLKFAIALSLASSAIFFFL